ncbi:hypothetical protein [Paenibacillus phytorum]|uniref:hypothetical protein n=1 Tax=Paenibacillus phytorum TaxID=2654977 RepID=UPI001492AE99|nr:hypothetical protein [Paenibacillus phytorum]
MSVLRTMLGAKSLKVKMTLLLLAVSLVPLLISMFILTAQSSSVVESARDGISRLFYGS